MYSDGNFFFRMNKTLFKQIIDDYLLKLSYWPQKNNLSLNTNKTSYITFTPVNKQGFVAIDLKYFT